MLHSFQKNFLLYQCLRLHNDYQTEFTAATFWSAVSALCLGIKF